jgi:esterase/lipase
LTKGEKDFAADYGTFFNAGESKAKEVGAPLLIKGKSKDLGVVLVHGFMAAPLEMKELAQYLGQQGLWVYAPRLKGHGTSSADLAAKTYLDWVESVDEGYAAMSNICRRVVIGGFSFGGGLSLDLAARVPKVAGVFAVCPPMRLHDISSKLAPAMGFWNRLMNLAHSNMAKKEFLEITLEHPQINYARLPVASINELEHFMALLEPKLVAIKTPALIVQSGGDPVVDPQGSKDLFERLGSEEKKYLLFEINRHGILLGDGAERVHAAIAEFIDCVRRGSKVSMT